MRKRIDLDGRRNGDGSTFALPRSIRCAIPERFLAHRLRALIFEELASLTSRRADLPD